MSQSAVGAWPEADAPMTTASTAAMSVRGTDLMEDLLSGNTSSSLFSTFAAPLTTSKAWLIV